MNPPLHEVFSGLADVGVIAQQDSLTKHHAQGFMSEVFTLRSSVGHLVMHIMKISPVQEHYRTWEKLLPLSALLREESTIPVPEVLYVHKFPEHFVVFQRLVIGTNAGRRDITNDDFIDTWDTSFESIAPQMERIIAGLHVVPVVGFGPLRGRDQHVAGEFDTWQSYLIHESDIWINAIQLAEQQRGSESDKLVVRIERLVTDLIPRIGYKDSPSIVHYDLINPSNILVHEGSVSGVVDWEYAIAADPAWEFTYNNKYTLQTYFLERGMCDAEQQSFRARVELYGYLCMMPWVYTHAANPQGKLYECLRALLLRRLDDWTSR